MAFQCVLGRHCKGSKRRLQGRCEIGRGECQYFAFVDDMVLVADNEESLRVNLTKLDEALTKCEMKINWEKTELMKVGKEREHRCVEVGDR